MIPPVLMISTPALGTGKTTLMLGLLAALWGQGVAVQPFKSGPDYIDPVFHTVASDRASFNVDSRSVPRTSIDGLVGNAVGANLILAEGSMGLFDGVAIPGTYGTGASADIVALMGWPVVLVLDVSGAAQLVVATSLGFKTMRPDVPLAGVVLNRVASPRHDTLVRVGMDAAGIPVLGSLPRQKEMELPERFLRLVQAGEQEDLPEILAAAAAFVTEHVDLAALRAAGDKVLPFSPLADQAPDPSADVCCLPGGHPELHVGKLAAAEIFRNDIQSFAQTKPVHGEIGGYMAMGAGLVYREGGGHQMAGFLGVETSFEKQKFHLGYRNAALKAAIPGYASQTRMRGHEFHYATILVEPDPPLAQFTDSNNLAVPETGSVQTFDGGGRATGRFFHMIAEAL